MLIQSTKVDQNHYRVFDCLLLPVGRQMAIKNTVFFYQFFYSHLSIVKSIFDCHLHGVIMVRK